MLSPVTWLHGSPAGKCTLEDPALYEVGHDAIRHGKHPCGLFRRIMVVVLVSDAVKVYWRLWFHAAHYKALRVTKKEQVNALPRFVALCTPSRLGRVESPPTIPAAPRAAYHFADALRADHVGVTTAALRARYAVRVVVGTDRLVVCPSPVPGHGRPSKSKPARQRSSRRFAPPCPGLHDWRRSPFIHCAKRAMRRFHLAHAVAR